MSRPVLASLAGFRRPSWLAAWRARRLTPEQRWVLRAAYMIAASMKPGDTAFSLAVTGLGSGEHVVAWRMRRDAVMPEVPFPVVPDDLSGLEDAG